MIAQNEHAKDSNGQIDLSKRGVVEIADVIRRLLADVFALYVKIKNFHQHMTGTARNPRLKDNGAERVPSERMIAELCEDNRELARYFRAAHATCERHDEVATTSLLEVWIDQTERRTWFLAEIINGN